MPIIDAHVHIGCWVQSWRSEDALADMVETALECGIGKLCVSSLGDKGYLAHPSPEALRSANDYTLKAVARFPDHLLGFCYVSPEHPQVALEEISRCIRDGPMVGIKLWVARKASDPAVDPVLREAVRLDVPVLQHAWYKRTGNLEHESTPADVALMAQRHPEATILMAHLNGAGEHGVQEIAPYPNVLVDTSGGDPESGLIEYAVQLLGAERIVFGSDAPGRDFSVQLGKVYGAELTESQRCQILGGNIARILHLEA